MNINTVLANLHTLPTMSLDKDRYEFVNALAALYGETLGFEEWDVSAVEGFAELQNTAIHTVFNFHHDSDEACYVQVISHKSVPFALIYKFGDTNGASSSVLNRDVFVEMGKLLAGHRLEMKLKEQEAQLHKEGSTSLTSLSELPNGFITWHSGDAGLFSMNGPSSMFRFDELPARYDAVVQLPDGILHKVKSMGFARQEAERYSRQSEQMVVVTEDGESHIVQGSEVAFFLFHQDDPVGVAQQACAQRDEWEVARTFTLARQFLARCVQYREGRLMGELASGVVREDEKTVIETFMQHYGAGRHAGVFTPADYGFHAG